MTRIVFRLFIAVVLLLVLAAVAVTGWLDTLAHTGGLSVHINDKAVDVAQLGWTGWTIGVVAVFFGLVVLGLVLPMALLLAITIPLLVLGAIALAVLLPVGIVLGIFALPVLGVVWLQRRANRRTATGAVTGRIGSA